MINIKLSEKQGSKGFHDDKNVQNIVLAMQVAVIASAKVPKVLVM